MTPTVRASLSAVAALFAGVLATFVLVSPPVWRGAFDASDRQVDAWLNTVPNGVVGGVVVAILACVALQRASSVRPAWVSAAVATAALIAVRMSVSGVSGLDQLTPLHYAKCMAAGVLLGAAVAAVWWRPISRLVLAGAVGATFVVAHTAHVGYTPSTSTLGEPFWWILVPMLVLTAACAALDDATPDRGDRDTAIGALAAVVTLALAHRLLGEWIDGQTGSRFRQWIVIALCLVLVVALTEFWARRLGSPFLLAATAVAAAAPFVATNLSQNNLLLTPWVSVTVGVASVVVGAVAGARRPSPLIGLAALAVIPLLTAIDPTPTDSKPWFLVELAVLGIGVGLALASTLPDTPSVAALGLAVPLVSLVFTTVVGATTSFVVFSGSYEPLPGVPFATPQVDSYIEDVVIFDMSTPSVTFDRTAAVAMLLVVAFCALAIRGLRTARSAPLPE